MRGIRSRLKKLNLTFLFAGIVFLILLVTMCLIFIGTLILQKFGIQLLDVNTRTPLFLFSLISLAIGTLLAFLLSSKSLTPIRSLEEAADKIAGGDYSVRVSLSGPDELTELGEHFNHMAEELGSVELLRKDFINDFSHEFRTPIVSIRGFAKILKEDTLSEEERREYLDIIIEESERLSHLSESVLNLSALEQQTILTGKSRFNVSEQIRQAIIILDTKWNSKKICFSFDGGECEIEANKELMNQVWMNLLDNAVKFSPDNGEVRIAVRKAADSLSIEIANQGSAIPPEDTDRIFEKFYQQDSSRSLSGNGLGLPIVKRILELHGGSVRVQRSDGEWTVFEVMLSSVLVSSRKQCINDQNR